MTIDAAQIAFFIIGVVPYWYTLWLPRKDLPYWATLTWACLVWLTYFTWIGQWAAAINNVVELAIATRGIGICLTKTRSETSLPQSLQE